MSDHRTHGDHSAVNDDGNADGTIAVSPHAALSAALLRAITDPGAILGETRPPEQTLSTFQLRAVNHVLDTGGWIIPGVPPVEQVLADARQYSDELVLTKLVARFFRVMILGAVVIPETPAAMDWLRDYIDGNHKVHGPLGKPMIWPGRLPAICQLLRDWGFQPTPTNPQYVSLRPGGAMLKMTVPDPEAPDPASVEPMDERRDPAAAAFGKMLDGFTSGVSCMALDRATVLRAMKAAYESGQFNGRHDVTPIIDALHQLRDQQRVHEGEKLVTVNLQALEAVLSHLAVNGEAGK